KFFPQVWKHAHTIFLLKPGKDLKLPSLFRSIILLDTTRKLFEKILLARILHEVNSRNLIRDDKYVFQTNHWYNSTNCESCRFPNHKYLMKAGVAQDRLISLLLFTLYVNVMLTPMRRVELSL
ncbi:hypothetical protein C0J52_13942, partial [Blattella germanica]